MRLLCFLACVKLTHIDMQKGVNDDIVQLLSSDDKYMRALLSNGTGCIRSFPTCHLFSVVVLDVVSSLSMFHIVSVFP